MDDDDNRRRLYALLIAPMIMVAVVAAAAAPLSSTTPTTNRGVDRTPTRNPTAPPLQAAWSKTYGGTREDGAYSVQQVSDGGYILAGETDSFGAGGHDFWLVKIGGTAALITPEILVVIAVSLVAVIGLAAILMRRWPRSS